MQYKAKMEEMFLRILLIGYGRDIRIKFLKYIDSSVVPSTLGITFVNKIITINNINVYLRIISLDCLERYRFLPSSYLRNNDGIIFIYDITDKETFYFIKDMIEYFFEYYENKSDKKKIIIFGIGCEKEYQRVVTKEMLKELCDSKNIKGIEVSTKTGEDILNNLEILAKSIIESKPKLAPQKSIRIDIKPKKKKNFKFLKLNHPKATKEKSNLKEDKKAKHSTLLNSTTKNKNNEDKIPLSTNSPNASQNQDLKKGKFLPFGLPDSTKEKRKEFANLFLFKYTNY